ncbi:MAG: sigma-54-dependent Fis family transcriptional regulator [Myxococcales bacterium]|nr:sigma-54-dependent Fis family transcriptional regulator [Myxococcales bacterium]
MSHAILIVDDDAELCTLLTLRLESRGYLVHSVGSVRDAITALDRHWDLVLVDLRLPGRTGLDVIAAMKERVPDVPALVLTAHGSIETAVDAMRRGAYGFLTKPFHDHDLLQKIAQAVSHGALVREVAGLRRIVGGASIDRQLVGTSEAIQKVRQVIERVARTEVTVLITGESGTGKELAARSLHAASPRADRPFVALNCAAIPRELLESELFGHTRGAFTGAARDRDGVFAAAAGSTLFLDEIGDAPPDVQVKLLRVLQEKRYTPVGSTTERHSDVRVLAATNRDLRVAVAESRFREDLYFRLHVLPLRMPALRERREDIPLLADVFLERAAARHHLPVPRIHEATLAAMLAYPWPGNVRELANVMEAALLLADSAELRPEHLALAHGIEIAAPVMGPSSWQEAALAPLHGAELPPLREARDAFERGYLVEVLRRSGGNVSAAARLSGRNRTDFYELMRRHGLSPAEFKD